MQDKPFFIGWESEPAASLGSFLRKITIGAAIASIAVA